jgi:redox-sensitive bicupin YhaK (pirin superfamily)
MIQRKLERVYTPTPQHGFLGNGHIARAVINGDFARSDPFIMLMDDRLDKRDNEPVGGPHPHAGFETVTLMLEGKLGEGEESLQAGDLQMMTAGSGIVHTETIAEKAKLHILQLWLTLPQKDRWAHPRLQELHAAKAPLVSGDGFEVKVHSGTFAGASAPIHNYVPLILADIRLQEGAVTEQTLPANFTTFLYVLEGSVEVGNEGRTLQAGQVGWLDRLEAKEDSELMLKGGPQGARVILYAGEPQHVPVVSHGPFIAETQDDIVRLYHEYRQGKMDHVSRLPASQVMKW